MKTIAISLFFSIALWLGACAQPGSRQPAATSEQQRPASEQPSVQSSQEREKSPGEGQSAQQTQPGGQNKAAKNAGDQPRDVKDRAPDGAPALAAPPADAAAGHLEAAKQKLRLSKATEQRIAAELEQLKQSGRASPEDIRNYEAYLESVRGLVAENRKIVARMQAAYEQRPVGGKNAATGGKQKAPSAQPDARETADEVTVLDRQLNASLDEFDGMLLKQMDEIRAESADTMRDLAQQAAEAARRLRKNGAAVDTASNQTENMPPSEGSRSDQGSAGTATASKEPSAGRGAGTAASKEHRAGYEDDDIVARQLREAAENETDPELKKKLWQEYEQYKKNQR